MKSSNFAPLFLCIILHIGQGQAATYMLPEHGSTGSALSAIHEPGKGRESVQLSEPWKKWAKNPLTVHLSLQPNNVYADLNTTLDITLAGRHFTVNGQGCTVVTNGALVGVDLNPRREYLLTVVGTKLKSMDLDLQIQPDWEPLSKSGKGETPTDYALWVNRALGSSVTGSLISASTNCSSYYSNVWRIEIRDEKPFHWYADDKSDDPTPAPGDGSFIEMGAAKSLYTNQIALDWSVSLGRLFDGIAAGRLRIRESGLTRAIYTPTNIYFTASSTNVRGQVELVTSSADGVLRQVKAYQTCVDIVPGTDQTTLNFYHPSQVSSNKNPQGIYTFTNSPFVAWVIQNPEPSTTNKLYIIENRNGTSRTNSLVCNPSSPTGTWTLTAGSGAEQRVETRGVVFTTTAPTNRIETVSTKYASSNSPAYKAIETYVLYDWGWELATNQTDPDNSNLKTTFAYYTNTSDSATYGKLSSITYPDGNWEKRLYHQTNDMLAGTLYYVLRPWKDLPSANPDDATIDNSDVTVYVFDTAVDRFMETAHCYATGEPDLAYRSDAFSLDDNGTYSETSEGRLGPLPESDLGTFILAAGRDAINGKTGHALWQFECQGTNRAMYYHGGTYNPSTKTFSTNGATVADGPDWRQSTIFYGYPEHLEPAEQEDEVEVFWAEGQSLLEYLSHQSGISLQPNRSYKETRIFRGGSLVQRELSVFTNAVDGEPQFEVYQKFVYTNDSLGHATNITVYDGANARTVYEADYKGAATYDGDLLLWETDETGTRTEYSYDTLKRRVAVTRKGVSASGGFPSQADILTTLRYDPTGKVIEQAVSSGAIGLTNKFYFDIAVRSTTNIDEKGLVTSFVYQMVPTTGEKTTTTLPSGETDISQNYLDRRLHTRSGTAVVQETHDYYPDDTDFEITLQEAITNGPPAGPRWKLVGTDLYGLTARWEVPDYNAANSVIERHSFESSLVQPSAIYKTGQENQYFFLDIDGTPGKTCLGPATTEAYLNTTSRITRTLKNFVKQGGAWFRMQTNFTYLVDNDATPTMTSISQERLSGFSDPTIASQVTTWDADTNATVVTRYIDHTAKKLTEVTDTAQSTLNATNITINGLLVAESTSTVPTPTMHYYDALGHETLVVSPLGFSSSTAYNQFGQVTNVTDVTGLSTAYDYYPNGGDGAGQLKSETRANGKKTYHSYTARGELLRTWGDVPYPEQRGYSAYGELTNLLTFRNGSSWNQPTWPDSQHTGTPESTVWQYDDTSGLLVAKIDNSGQAVTYTYTNRMLLTRSWARTVSGSHVTVTNSYNDFADLARQDYNDGTPTVQFNNFNRAGQPREIVDATGTNALAYDFAQRLLSTTAASLNTLAGVTVSNHYSAPYGRDSLTWTVGGQATTANYTHNDSFGRLGTVSCGSYSAVYGYLTNSDLLRTTTCENNTAPVLTTTRSWDYGARLSAILNQANGAIVTSHSYTYDGLNRRTRASLEDGSVWTYDYNDRDELTSGRRFWSDWSPASGQLFGYNYDNIGNRTSASSGGDTNGAGLRTTTYNANDLNEYTNIVTLGYKDIMGAAFATNAVTVNSGTADRKGEYFHKEITVANGGGPLWQNVTNVSAGTTVNGGLVFPGNTQYLTNDADGNLTYDGIWTYEWDGENRLRAMSMTNVANITNANRLRLEFGYDYLNRRFSKTVKQWDGGGFSSPVTTLFIYDGWNLLAELSSATSMLRAYMWGQDLSGTMDQAGGIGGLLGLFEILNNQIANCHFPTYDGNGNLTALVRAGDLSTTAQYEWSPYGEALRATGPMSTSNAFRFSTKFTDNESGLTYYGRRYFSPVFGRWLSRDPAEESGGLNLLVFILNAPTMGVDDLGMVRIEFDPKGLHVHDFVNGQKLTYGVEVGEDGVWKFTNLGGEHASEFDADLARISFRDILENPAEFQKIEAVNQAGWHTFQGVRGAGGTTERAATLFRSVGRALGALGAFMAIVAAANGAEEVNAARADYAKDARNGDQAYMDLDAVAIAIGVQDMTGNYFITTDVLGILLQ